jgi:hypothetical protein
MPMEIEGRTQPASNEPSVSYSFWKPEEESFQLRPVTPEQAQEMLKQNLLIRQIVEEGKPDFSLGSRIFGDGIFRWRKDSAELERWQALRDLVGADLVGADGSSGSSVAVPETEGAAWIRKHGTVGESASVGAALVPPEDKEYKPSESILDGVEYVPPGGSAQFGLGGAEGQSLHIQAVPLPGQFVPASAFDGGGSTVGTMGLGGVHYAIDPGDPEQGRPGGFQVFLSFAEVGPEGGVFSFDVSGDRPLNVSLPANYFASPIPQPRSELFADDAEYANYLEVHARLYETLELLQDRQLAIATGQQAPPRPPGGARMDSALNQLFDVGFSALDTGIGDTLRLFALLTDGIPIFPIVVSGPGLMIDPSRTGGQTLLQYLGARSDDDESLPVQVDNMLRDGITALGGDPQSPAFESTRTLLELVSVVTTGAYLTDSALRLFQRPGGALMLQLDIPPGLVAPGDIGRTATTLQALVDAPTGSATLHPSTLAGLQRLAIENPHDPHSQELFDVTSRLLREQPDGSAALRAHAYLGSGVGDAFELQGITRQFQREAGISLEDAAQRGQQLHGKLNVLAAQERQNLLAQADLGDLAGLDPNALSQNERIIVAARIAQQAPPTNYVNLDQMHRQSLLTEYNYRREVVGRVPELAPGEFGVGYSFDPTVTREVFNLRGTDGFIAENAHYRALQPSDQDQVRDILAFVNPDSYSNQAATEQVLGQAERLVVIRTPDERIAAVAGIFETDAVVIQNGEMVIRRHNYLGALAADPRVTFEGERVRGAGSAAYDYVLRQSPELDYYTTTGGLRGAGLLDAEQVERYLQGLISFDQAAEFRGGLYIRADNAVVIPALDNAPEGFEFTLQQVVNPKNVPILIDGNPAFIPGMRNTETGEFTRVRIALTHGSDEVLWFYKPLAREPHAQELIPVSITGQQYEEVLMQMLENAVREGGP